MRQPCPVCAEPCSGISAERSGHARDGDRVTVRFRCVNGHRFGVKLAYDLYLLCRAARYAEQGANVTLHGRYAKRQPTGAGGPEKATMEHKRTAATKALAASLALRKAGRGWWE